MTRTFNHDSCIFITSLKNMFEEELPKEEITRLRKAFALFDVDGDGSISTKVSFWFRQV